MSALPITISQQAAADLTDLSVRTIGRLVASGKVRSIKIGRRRLVYRDSVLELVGAKA